MRMGLRDPFSARCAYYRGQLSATTIAQVDRMHPSTNAEAGGFRLRGSDHPASGGEPVEKVP